MYEQTFWGIHAAFEAGQAAQALAKRGINIDSLFTYWGPGGAGLSLFTSHLAAMYGPTNHKYFDPNVFYQDEELRKTIELLVGGFIFTGQERPVGSRDSVREDLLKKFITAEGLSGRMPYAILTKLFKVMGWKRIEVNKLVKYSGITMHNYESILRRNLIVKIMARFFDEAYLKKYMPDHAEYGIFARDPSAKDFAVSGPAVAAGHKVQAIFERSFSMCPGLCPSSVKSQRYERCLLFSLPLVALFAFSFDSFPYLSWMSDRVPVVLETGIFAL